MTLLEEYFWNPDQAAQGEKARVGKRGGDMDRRRLTPTPREAMKGTGA